VPGREPKDKYTAYIVNMLAVSL